MSLVFIGASVVVLSIVFIVIRGSIRGFKIGKRIYLFESIYKTSIEQGNTKDFSLRLALQEIRKAPRVNDLSDNDIDMIAKIPSSLNDPCKPIITLLMKGDSRKALLVLKELKMMSNLHEISKKYEYADDLINLLKMYKLNIT